MALVIPHGAPTLLIKRAAYESSGLSRAGVDERLGLTADEFRVEGDLVVIGPIFTNSLGDVIAELEQLGLAFYEDFFELSGNWPQWLTILATSRLRPATD